MRTKDEILNDLRSHTDKLDPQHYELASVAMIETEIQIDIRDSFGHLITAINSLSSVIERKD